MRSIYRALTLATFICLSMPALADDYTMPDPLFQSNEPLDVTITYRRFRSQHSGARQFSARDLRISTYKIKSQKEAGKGHAI
jgi:hypothetical protein